jgi:hypothetical protein
MSDRKTMSCIRIISANVWLLADIDGNTRPCLCISYPSHPSQYPSPGYNGIWSIITQASSELVQCVKCEASVFGGRLIVRSKKPFLPLEN